MTDRNPKLEDHLVTMFGFCFYAAFLAIVIAIAIACIGGAFSYVGCEFRPEQPRCETRKPILRQDLFSEPPPADRVESDE